MGIVVSMCDFTCNVARPWADAGFTCYCIDVQHPTGTTQDGNIFKVGASILDCVSLWLRAGEKIDFAFAAPPCTHTATSGARHFISKGPQKAAEAFELIARVDSLCKWFRCPYAWEQPVAVTSTYCGKPDYTFDPCEYAAYLPDPTANAYTKKTCLWTGGGFKMPEPKAVAPVKVCPQGSWLQRKGGSSLATKNARSATPKGFAVAMFQANCTTYQHDKSHTSRGHALQNVHPQTQCQLDE
jgi:hypothetical protein